MLYTTVEGGTGAGRVKPLATPFPNQWRCSSCDFNNEKYFRNCFKCYAPRPKFQ